MGADDIKAIHEKLDILIAAQAGTNARVEAICENAAKMHKDYYGNGDGGTRREVTALKTQMGMITKVGGMGVAALLSTAVAAAWALILSIINGNK